MRSEDIRKKIHEIKKLRILTLQSDILTNLVRYVKLVEKYKNSYTWTPPLKAYNRRLVEQNDHVEQEFELNGDKISLLFNVSCSCNNYYITKHVIVNEEYKDVRFVKKLLKNLDIGESRKNEAS